MPSSSRTKRKTIKKLRNDRKIEIISSIKEEKVEDSTPVLVTFEDGCDVVSSILGETRKGEKVEDDIVSIASDTLLCLEEVYCDANPAQESTTENWGPETTTSIVIGSGKHVDRLKYAILEATTCHEVDTCKVEESFEQCNVKKYVLIWLMMEMPVGPDILSLTTSIRYASKFNKNTTILGVANSPSNVDLRLHGIDEIVVRPVEGTVIRQKYSKWTAVTIVPDDIECCENEPTSHQSSSDTATGQISSIPTNSSEKIEKGFRISVNNSTGQLSLAQVGGINIKTMPPSSTVAIKQRHHSQSDHTTKEKVRRERIKDSCDQLRVLLPYIRGRKTDMASILEMCVDYLRLVNAALPQEFQNQIVDILARDSAGSESPDKKNKAKKPTETDVNTVSSTVDTDVNNNEVTSGGDGGSKNIDVERIEDNDPLVSSNPSKRFRFLTDNYGAAPSPCLSSTPSYDAITRKEQINNDQSQSSYTYNNGYNYFNDYDIQSYSRSFNNHEPFANAFYGQALQSKQSSVERDSFGLFMDPQSYYQFYGGNSLCSYNVSQVPDYVNPNAVLPLSNDGGNLFDDHNASLSSQSSHMSTEERRELVK